MEFQPPSSPHASSSGNGQAVASWSVKKLKHYLQSHNVPTEQFSERAELVAACQTLVQRPLVDLLRKTKPDARISPLLTSELLSRTPGLSSLSDLPPVQTKVCGKVFKDGDLAYNCLTCQSDGTCVQCQDCFRASNHEGHVGITFHRTGSGGTCDCGDFESWREEGCCPTHQQSVDEDPSRTLPPTVFAAGTQVFASCVHFLLDICELEAKSFHSALPNRNAAAAVEEEKGEIHVLLHNDDYHLYEEVNESLEPILGVSQIVGRPLPEVVQIDKQGRAEIFKVREGGIASALERLNGSRIRANGLIVSFALSNQLDLERNAVAVVAWIQTVCKSSPALARVFVQQLIAKPEAGSSEARSSMNALRLFSEWSLASNFSRAEQAEETPEEAQSLLDVICQVSTILPKMLVLQLRELFLHLIYDDLFKCEISASVGKHLPKLAVACARGLGVEEDSLLQMSFHFFTSKQIARAFAEKTQDRCPLLRPIIAAVSDFLTETDHASLIHRAIANRRNRLFFQAFRYQVNLGLLSEMPVALVLQLVDDFQTGILAQLHFLDPHRRRQESTHVEYESETWHVAFDMTMETFLNLIHPMVMAILECEETVVRAVVDQVFSRLDAQCGEPRRYTTFEQIYRGEAPISFHLPLHRFACDLFLGAIRKFPQGISLQGYTNGPLHALADCPLRLLVATCQMAHGLWVRDGQTVFVEQSYYRGGARFCFHDLDVKLLALATRLDAQFLLKTVEDVFLAGGSGGDILEEYLKLCIALFHAVPVVEEEAMLECALIHALAAAPNGAPVPLTDIIQSLHQRRAIMDSFEEEEEDIPTDLVVKLLGKVATQSVDHNGERKFALKPQLYLNEVDANSWFLGPNEREQVSELREQKLRNFPDVTALALCPSKPLACLDWFTPVRDAIASDAFVLEKLVPILRIAVLGNEQLWRQGVPRVAEKRDAPPYTWLEAVYKEALRMANPNLVKTALYVLTLALEHRQSSAASPIGTTAGWIVSEYEVNGPLSILECVFALRSLERPRDLETLGLEWVLRQLAQASPQAQEFLAKVDSERASTSVAPNSGSASAGSGGASAGKTKKAASKKRKAADAQQAILEKMRLAQQRTSAMFQEEEERAAETSAATTAAASAPAAAAATAAAAVEEEEEGDHMCSLCRSSGNVQELGYFAYSHETSWFEPLGDGKEQGRVRALVSNPDGAPADGWEPPPKSPALHPFVAAVPPPFQAPAAAPHVATAAAAAAAEAVEEEEADNQPLDWGMQSSAGSALLMSQAVSEDELGDLSDDEEGEVLEEDMIDGEEGELMRFIFENMQQQQNAGFVITQRGDGEEEEDLDADNSSSSGGEGQEEDRASALPSLSPHGLLPPRLHVRTCGHLVHLSCLHEYQRSSVRNPLGFATNIMLEYTCSLCKATSNCVLLLPHKANYNPLAPETGLFRDGSMKTPPSFSPASRDICRRMFKRSVCANVDDEREFFACAMRTLVQTWSVQVDAKLRAFSNSNGEEVLAQVVQDATRYSSQHLALFETLARASNKYGKEEWQVLCDTGKPKPGSRLLGAAGAEEGKLTSIAQFCPFSLFIALAMLHWDELTRAKLNSMARLALGVFTLQLRSSSAAQERFGFECKLAFCFKVLLSPKQRQSEEALDFAFGNLPTWNLSPQRVEDGGSSPLLLRALAPRPLSEHFVVLPSKYDDLYTQVMQSYRCPTRKQLSRDVAICLVCGQCVCAGASCCSRKRMGIPHGAATAHGEVCSASLGVFLMLQRCQILLLYGGRAMFLPAPYVDSNGYPDPNLARGKPLVLNEERYAALQRMVADHLVPAEIMRYRHDLQRQFQVPIDFHF